MPRTCIDVPPTVGKAHLKYIKSTADYGQGTQNNDVYVVGLVFLGIAVVILAIALWVKWT